MLAGKGIICREMARKRFVRDTEMVESRFLERSKDNARSIKDINKVAQEEEKDCVQEFLKNKSLLIWPWLLEAYMESHRVKRGSSYSVFTSEPLRSLHLRVHHLSL